MKTVQEAPELYQEALFAYQKWCEDHAFVYRQPSIVDTKIGRQYVYLHNTFGLVAKYDIRKKAIVYCK